MQINSELCHVDSSKIIVKVTISENQIPLSSALGQGKDVKEAESNALDESISRLNYSLSELIVHDKKENNMQHFSDTNSKSDTIKAIEAIDERKNITKENKSKESERNNPNDWSEEISQIEHHIKRLEWSKDQEDYFIRKTLEYPSRDRISKYEDMLLLIWLLKKLNKENSVKDFEQNISQNELMIRSDKLINKLAWETNKAKENLNQNFRKHSRSLLSTKELLQFIQLLENELEDKK